MMSMVLSNASCAGLGSGDEANSAEARNNETHLNCALLALDPP
jgi:hypothetical protein